MDNEVIKSAMMVLQDEKKTILNNIAKSINAEKSANRKIMDQSHIERMREANRQVYVINELCSNFEDVVKDEKTITRKAKTRE